MLKRCCGALGQLRASGGDGSFPRKTGMMRQENCLVCSMEHVGIERHSHQGDCGMSSARGTLDKTWVKSLQPGQANGMLSRRARRNYTKYVPAKQVSIESY